MKPLRIFIVRHGQSEGNVDKTIYAKKPDYALELTQLGIQQASDAGSNLKQLARTVGNGGKFAIYYSPFFRSIQTLNNIIPALGKENIDYNYIQEDPRIREQEWHGNIPEVYDEEISEKMETACHMYGKFFYRFPGGESSADVYDRVSDFINSLHRDFENVDFPENVIIVSHGMTMRVFMHRWFKRTVSEFESWCNPHNCEIWKLEITNQNKYHFDFATIPTKKILHNYACKLELPHAKI